MKKAKNLAKSYELGTCEYDYYNYIVDSYINGQKKQCIDLFKQMNKQDRSYFLNNYFVNVSNELLKIKDFIISQIV
jgi:hypothetical protein